MDLRIGVSKLPIEIQDKIWREVYSEVVATIYEKEVGINWAKNKSIRLKELLKNEVGAYQCGYTDFDINYKIQGFHCDLCAHVNFPCPTCALFLYDETIEPGIFYYDFEPFIDDFNWEDPHNNEYIWDDDF